MNIKFFLDAEGKVPVDFKALKTGQTVYLSLNDSKPAKVIVNQSTPPSSK